MVVAAEGVRPNLHAGNYKMLHTIFFLFYPSVSQFCLLHDKTKFIKKKGLAQKKLHS